MLHPRFLAGMWLMLLATATLLAQPTLPQSAIPPRVSAGTRKNLERLYSEKPSERALAARDLHGVPEAIPFLLSMLGDIADAEVFEARYAGNPETPGRRAAITLATFGSRVVPPLITSLTDPDWHVRAHAAFALGQIGNPRATAPIGALLQDPEHQVRLEAVTALGSLDDDAAIEALLTALQDTDAMVRAHAMQSLADLQAQQATQPLQGRLSDDTPAVRTSAIYALVQLGNLQSSDAVLPLLSDAHGQVRETAAAAMSHWKTWQAVAPLMNMLADKETSVRSAAAMALGEIGDRQAIAPLRGALKDTAAEVRGAAARALGMLHDTEAVPQLLALLTTEKERYAVVGLVWAHGELRDARAVQPLIGFLRNPNYRRLALDDGGAVGALVKIGAPAVPSLLALAGEKKPEIRCLALSTLGGIGDTRALNVFITGSTDADANVSRCAVQGLTRLRDLRAVPALMTQLRARWRWSDGADIINALGLIGDPRAVDLIILALGSGASDTHLAAVVALGRISDAKAAPALLRQYLQFQGPLQRAAYWGLVRMGPKAMPALLGALRTSRCFEHKDDDDPLRYPMNIGGMLARIGNPAYGPVVALLKDPNPAMRANAAYILGLMRDPRALSPLRGMQGDTNAVVKATVAWAIAWCSGQPPANPADEYITFNPFFTNARAHFDSLLGAKVTKEEAEEWARTLTQAGEDRKYTALLLGWRADPRALPVLRELLQDDEAEMRAMALIALERYLTLTDLMPYRQAMKDPDPRVRVYAAMALARRDDPEGTAHLMSALHDTDVEVAGTAAYAIMQTPAFSMAVPDLIDLLYSSSENQAELLDIVIPVLFESRDGRYIRPLLRIHPRDDEAWLYHTLFDIYGKLYDPRMMAVVYAALDDRNPEVRDIAIQVIGGYADVQAAPRLFPLLHVEDAITNDLAAIALEKLTGQQFGTDARRWEDWWKAQQNK